MSDRKLARKKPSALPSCLLVLAQILCVLTSAGICQNQDKIKEFKQRLESTPPTDACALYKLSTWCAQNGLPIQRILVLQRVITACPEHEKARLELGYVKHKGKWLTQAEVNISKGLTLIDGEWLAKNE
ncbi:MAG: hypothetical protein RDV41_10840, partial [Planctomycetota bacterium]|nr:hypothetical protein [Planctomycetota bacterium]